MYAKWIINIAMHRYVGWASIIEGISFSYEMSNDSSFDLGSLEKIGAFSSHGYLLFNVVVIWGIFLPSLFWNFIEKKLGVILPRFLFKGY